MNLYIFWKNVNKQLKSADFFFWDVKISKKSINKNFVAFYFDVKTYLSLGSPSTQYEISHSWYPLFVICRKIEMEKVSLKNSIDFTSLMPIVFCINWTAHIIQRNLVKIEIFNKSWRKSVNFFYPTDRNVSVAGYKYNQCQFFGISISSQFILFFLQ